MAKVSICKLCGSSDNSLYLKTSAFSIFRCNSCTNAWTDPAPVSINYIERDFHQQEISQKGKEIRKIADLPVPWQNSIAKQIKLIQKYLPPGGSILEIGCGEGILLKELHNIGYKTFGVEPSLTAATRAKEQGLEVVQGYFPTDGLEEKSFDLIIMSHVFEHLEKPLEILESAKNHLAPAGKLMFVQTYYQGIVPRLLGKKWYAWVADQHFWHFTPAGIVKIAEPFNFSELDREFSSLVYYNKGKRSLTNSIFLLMEKIFLIFPGKLKDQFHLIISLK
ncbi:MAG: class I SAM-dependent methyltransferase [Cyclobacteriaceae bacterium]|nr:class I SAM-dependent methyltransferase [Cyclobacteriaceae bacterium]